LGQVYQGNQDYIQQQDKDSRCQVEDRVFQIGKMKYSRFHNWIQSLSYEGRHKWPVYNIFAKEECITGHH